ncbi:hypothetical protein SAY86_027042 [Trapa natans]|uniref:40S ribosomal protein S21 n=1 Tax=Trapa natans TaxID=22666 RepID=A0AAN7KTN1_TRANT|nr:hypothetical protein SAY86_027042 [Trapa natans]
MGLESIGPYHTLPGGLAGHRVHRRFLTLARVVSSNQLLLTSERWLGFPNRLVYKLANTTSDEDLVFSVSDSSAAHKELVKMQNEEGQNMDLYIPRKCSATNRLITSKDHASVQINIGHLGPDGVYTNQFTTFALCGFIRAQVFF